MTSSRHSSPASDAGRVTWKAPPGPTRAWTACAPSAAEHRIAAPSGASEVPATSISPVRVRSRPSASRGAAGSSAIGHGADRAEDEASCPLGAVARGVDHGDGDGVRPRRRHDRGQEVAAAAERHVGAVHRQPRAGLALAFDGDLGGRDDLVLLRPGERDEGRRPVVDHPEAPAEAAHPRQPEPVERGDPPVVVAGRQPFDRPRRAAHPPFRRLHRVEIRVGGDLEPVGLGPGCRLPAERHRGVVELLAVERLGERDPRQHVGALRRARLRDHGAFVLAEADLLGRRG